MMPRAQVKPQTFVLYDPQAVPQSLASDVKGHLFYEGTITSEQPHGPLVRIVFTVYDFRTSFATSVIREVPLWTLFPHPHNARYILAEARTPAGYLDYDGYWVRDTPDFKVAIVSGANANYLADRLRSGMHKLGGPDAQVVDLLVTGAVLGVLPDYYGTIVWKVATQDDTQEPMADDVAEVYQGTPAVTRAVMAAVASNVKTLRPFQCADCSQSDFHITDLNTERRYIVSVVDEYPHIKETNP
jgi:hypothetical protein